MYVRAGFSCKGPEKNTKVLTPATAVAPAVSWSFERGISQELAGGTKFPSYFSSVPVVEMGNRVGYWRTKQTRLRRTSMNGM